MPRLVDARTIKNSPIFPKFRRNKPASPLFRWQNPAERGCPTASSPAVRSHEGTAEMSSTESNAGAVDTRKKVQKSVDTVRDDLAEVRETAGHMRDQLKDAGKHAVSGVRDKVRDEANAKVDRATGSFRRVADELDRAAENCANDEEWASKLFTAGSASLKSVSDYLSGARLETLVSEGEAFARRNPVAFIGGAIAAGFFLSRVGKTAAVRAHDLTNDSRAARSSTDEFASSRYSSR